MKTSMLELINELWYLKRDLVSEGYDTALNRLAQEVPMRIHEYPSGQSCWTWRIPEKWTCRQAYLETLDGKRLLDVRDHPLHVVSYSLPFKGVVSRAELIRHLHSHPTLPEAIPFVFKYYERDWGLCASQALRNSLDQETYRVVIDTTFEPGRLKVGEIVVPGERDETFMLVAHLCHPAMVNDDLTGVVVGLDVARQLLAGPKPYFTYRMLILPETIGSVAYLSSHEELIPQMVGGLFLEMLGNDSPFALQHSFTPDSQADKVMQTTLRGLDPNSYHAPYRQVINNDERQFNAPGVRVPMLSLSRVEPPGSPTRPYREYHSSLDTPEIVNSERLEQARETVLKLIHAWEANQYVVNKFKGEVFASGYGLWIDYRQDPEGHRILFQVMEHCDGEHTLADIACELDTTFQAVEGVVNLLAEKGLVYFSRERRPTTPQRSYR
jgi:aminopeptidase-like protein